MKKLEKYDYIAIFIVLLGAYFLVTQYTFSQKVERYDESVEIEVVAPAQSTDLNQIMLSNIKELYFSNAEQASLVKSISKNGEKLDVVLDDKGLVSDKKTIFAGQHTGLNQRVKLHGLLEAEGVVTSIKKAD
jgi:uncharacterized protein YpmB